MEKPFDVETLVEKVAEILPPGLCWKRLSPDPALHHSAPLPFPVDITFRHGKGKEAICALIRDKVAKLDLFADHIRRVHVVVKDMSPEAHRKHRHHIGIQVAIIDDKPVMVSHNTDHADRHENIYLGIRITFGMAYHQVKYSVGKRRAKRFRRRGPSRQEIVDECD